VCHSPLTVLNQQIVACRLCPRLTEYRERIAIEKRRAFRSWEYWGKPVPGFGEDRARLLIVGLAPAAHGANRTGRVFTGDRSGDFLYRALYETGFASQPHSVSKDDGLVLYGAYISSAVRCAPPDNKPTLVEIHACRGYLAREIDLLENLRVVVALGALGFNAYLSILRDRGEIASRAAFRFGHNVEHRTGPAHPLLIGSYHPSQQNTSTGRLTLAMLIDVFRHAKAAAAS
jgi:uracil-DNA glycosylase family 4